MGRRHFLAFIFLMSATLSAANAQSLSTHESASALEQRVIEGMRQARLEQLQNSGLQFDMYGKNMCAYVSGISAAPPTKEVALTFDDGPSPTLTPYVLDLLKKYRIKATFFMLGNNATGHSELVHRVYEEGNNVGSHSWDHPNFHILKTDVQQQQVLRTEAVLAPEMSTPKYFRYPYGNSTCETNNLLHSRGYRIVGWHIDSCDWAFATQGTVNAKDAAICEVKNENRSNFKAHVLEQIHRRQGGIILMHDIHEKTIHQLEEIIEDLLRDGYQFTTLESPEMQSSLR